MKSALMIRETATFSSQGDRPGQEDFLLNLQEKGIFVVADGFGGPLPGAEAAKTACEAVKGFLVKEAGDLEATLPFVLRSYYSLAGNVLFNALIHANRKVTVMNRGKNVHERGGASVLAGFMDGDLLALANVGACSAWLCRGGKGRELVMPRTYGRLRDPFSTERNGESGVPLTSVGTSDDLEPEIFECRVQPGDWLLLHTDGIGQELLERIAEAQQLGGPATQSVMSILEPSSFSDNASMLVIVF